MTGVTNPQEGGVIGTALHPAQLFHVGIVCRDIDATMAEMSANLGLTWKGGRPALHDLVIDGEVNKDAVWTYKAPKEAAKQITGYLAFWKGVEII